MIDMIKSLGISLSGFALNQVLPAIILTVIGLLAIRVLMKIVRSALSRSHLEKAAHSLIKSLVQTVLYVLLGLMVANRLGFDVTGIIALASVLTLAISLAVQDVLTNVFGGFTLLYTQPFHSGDFVEIAGLSGSVTEIGLAYTKLLTADNKQISIPNKSVVAAQIVNYTTTGKRRVDFTVTASYDTPIPTVLSALQEAAQVPTILESEGIFTGVSKYGDHAIEYVLRVWSATDDYWTTHYAINLRIKEVFDAQGVVMTYPHLNIHLNKGE
jgi:small conductance mechanosensitive channel